MFRALCAFLLLAGSAQGAIINGDFENGLNGWTSVLEDPPITTISVEDGQLKLYTSGPAYSTRIEVGQTFTLDNKGSLSFDWSIDIGTNPTGQEIYLMAFVDDNAQLVQYYNTGELTDSGTYTAPSEMTVGAHSLLLVLFVDSPNVDPMPIVSGYFDNVQVSIPEPATFLLAGFLPLAFALKRLQQRK